MKKRPVVSWMLYDWGNSAFATTMMAAVLPIFYQNVATVGVDDAVATSYWGYSQSIAVLIVALLAPILGAISDYSASKKQFLRFFAYMGILASVLMAFVQEGQFIFASLLLIIGTIGFSGGNVFYDAFLPEVAKGKDLDRVSTGGFAFGYIGGGVLLAINLGMIMAPQAFFLPDTLTATRAAFISVGLWWFIFSIPLFRNIREEKRVQDNVEKKAYVRIGFTRVSSTFKELRQYKQLLIFLLAFWLYNDGISTIIKMATIYGAEIGIGTNDLIMALVITQFVGIPCTFLFGWLATKMTAKRALTIALYVYIGIVALGYFMTTSLHFYILATCVGLVQGGAQALSRSIFGRMVPDDRHAEFFGFYGISSKFAAIFGPFLFGFVGQLTGSSRYGIVSLLVFFIIGVLLLQKVDVDKGQKQAQEATVTKDTVTVHT
ncbi:MFS transporter [Pontibacillus halophilus JSM 076056 = DSM 19796]|uniref:MFS transporter n=1 Tax=Pontibacillus halophilus JSM 076056 = DSM 19796 TaxID=1385510 RepID=A0A0A5GKT9_9BACI|nr:MFS transporter [Pontibacillus halophilus]KGX92579.1 MFS transporter [Pontibacillus halophilus JSM 076056 = DSM 19796]